MHLREDAKDLEITMPSYTTGFILKAELHRIMSWDTWKLPQKSSRKNERPISLFFLEIWSLVFTPLPRKPWENGNGCFISTKIYHSPKERKKYGLKEKSRLLLIQNIPYLWCFPETSNHLILQYSFISITYTYNRWRVIFLHVLTGTRHSNLYHWGISGSHF